ncbi:MAG: hypothetical protein ACLSDQ_10370 [Adlercreutzia equolifaciens]
MCARATACSTCCLRRSAANAGAGIRPTFFVDGSRLGFINDFDLYTLIGNAADNAIEATSQLPLGEARESSWCPCRPRLESARAVSFRGPYPEARVHLMAAGLSAAVVASMAFRM